MLLILSSCQKQLSFIIEQPASPPPPPPVVNKCRLVKTIQGTGTNDTTINFHYNNNLLSFIENTGYQDTVKLLYTNTTLLGLDRTHAGPVTVEYNVAGKPIRVESYGNR